MQTRQLVTMAVAALVVIGGATAVGAAAPDQAADNAPGGDAGHTAAVDSDAPADVGPSEGLAEQVPDHVSTILDTIDSFHSGDIDSLGETVSGLPSSGPTDEAGASTAYHSQTESAVQ